MPSGEDSNKKMIGQLVKVVQKECDEWQGLVNGVKDNYTLFVNNGQKDVEVDIFDIRSLT